MIFSSAATMASSQLDNLTPQGSTGMTICLPFTCRAIVHSALKYKSGYLTLSRFNSNNEKWRNVHIAKKSVEKLVSEADNLLDTFKKTVEYQVSSHQETVFHGV